MFLWGSGVERAIDAEAIFMSTYGYNINIQIINDSFGALLVLLERILFHYKCNCVKCLGKIIKMNNKINEKFSY